MTPEETGWTPEKIERYNRDVMDQALAEIERLRAELVTERERTAGELKELVAAYGEINRLRDVNRRNIVEMERLAGDLAAERARFDFVFANAIDADSEIVEVSALDYIDWDKWEEQGGNWCPELARAWRAAFDAAMAKEAKDASDE